MPDVVTYLGATDAELVTAIARGQPEGLAEAYERHGGHVFSMALRLCGTDLAGDATRAAFLCLWHTPLAFDPSRGSLRTCLVAHAEARAVVLSRAVSARQARDEMCQTSSGATRAANSSTRARPSPGQPQTR